MDSHVEKISPWELLAAGGALVRGRDRRKANLGHAAKAKAQRRRLRAVGNASRSRNRR